MRARLDKVDAGFAISIMQQMSDEIAKRPTQDHKLTTMARYLVLLQAKA